jgi:hypothetical protein
MFHLKVPAYTSLDNNTDVKLRNCFDFAVECTYKRPSRRRRNPSLAQTSPPNVLPRQTISPQSDDIKPPENQQRHSSAAQNGLPDYTGAYVSIREGESKDILGVAWRSFALASLDTIDQYMQIYVDVVYPLFPLFHTPTLWKRLRLRHHLTDRPFFASVMSACAIAAARARDGAIAERYVSTMAPEKLSEIFFSAAQDAIPKDLNQAQGLGYMRACGLLALTSIQYGQIKTMHHHLGMYHALAAMQHFHDETHWPANITVVEKEERRRLFWSMYSLDIYTSVVFDAIMKSQETHSNVRYPSEVNDEDLTAGVSSPTNSENWLRGWNFATDLYRVLEHSVKRMCRQKKIRDDRIAITRLLITDGIPEAQIMDHVLELYYQLPARFRDFHISVTGDKSQDLFGFQAANIQATIQLVRMTLFSTGLQHDVELKCNIAEQVLATFHRIAPEYLRAISTPLVYHLGCIGQVLASVMEGPLCEISYHRVRGSLVSMADLLEGLESGLQPTAGASRDLRKQIDRIDQYMAAQRRTGTTLPPQQPPHTITGAENHNLQGGVIPQMHPSTAIPTINGYGVQTSMDEFQLPPDLVNDGAWPWPFELTHVNQIQPSLAFH